MCTLEKHGNKFFLTLIGDDEHRFNPTLIDKIRSLLNQIRADAKPGSVLITTAEGKFFSNGLDLAWAQATGSANFRDRLYHISESFKLIISDMISLPLPTIAAVTGHAAAAGFILALSHDYVLMRNDKGFIYMSELDIGLSLSDYFKILIRSKISSPMARRDVLMGAGKLKAEKAVEMGIIDSAHDSPRETVEAAVRLGEKLASRKWNGEVYAEIRKGTFGEVCQVLGLVEKEVVAVAARL